MLLLSYIFSIGFVFQILVISLTYFLISLLYLCNVRRRRFKLLTDHGFHGPEPSLLSGSINWFLSNPWQGALAEESKRKNGSIFSWWSGDEPTLVVTDLDVLKTVFFDRRENFRERCYRYMVGIPIMDGIFFAPYRRWKLFRKLLTPAFNGYAIKGDSSTKFIDESIALMLDYIERKQLIANETGEKAIFDIQSLMKATALHLISTIAIKMPNIQVIENEPNVKGLDKFMELLNGGTMIMAMKFPFIVPLLSFIANNFEHSKVIGKMRKSINQVIDEGRVKLASGQWDDCDHQVLDTLVKLHHEGKLTRDEVIGNAETLLIAGYDTTATSLTYIFWVIAKNPEIQGHLRDELKAHGTDSEYLDQVINEVMRLYPVVVSFTTRVATSTTKANGITIPQGTRVLYHNWLMHRDPKLWNDPLKFDPSRFESNKQLHPCAYAPFGLGEKKCLGMQLALIELRTIVCDILLRFEITLISPKELELVNHGPVMSKPKEPVILQIEKLQQEV